MQENIFATKQDRTHKTHLPLRTLFSSKSVVVPHTQCQVAGCQHTHLAAAGVQDESGLLPAGDSCSSEIIELDHSNSTPLLLKWDYGST